MTASLAAARAEPVAGRSVFTALVLCELRRFAVNPVFLAGAALTAFTAWAAGRTAVTEIDTVTPYPAIYLGGFGMMAAFWQTRSMRVSEPIVGTTPATLPMRTAALCTVAIMPFLCGVASLIAFRLYHPVAGHWVYGAFSPPARIAVLVEQMVLPALGGPLLGVTVGRWVRFPGAALGAVPHPVRLGEPGHDREPHAPGPDTERGAAAVRAVRVLHVLRECHRGHHLARVTVVVHRLAVRPVRDRGTRGAAARGREPGPVHDRPCPADCPGGSRAPARTDRRRRARARRPRMMAGPALRAGAWPAVAGVSAAAMVAGGCGVLFPAATTVLFPLLAAAAAFALDEPASLVVDVTPTGAFRRTAVRALALLVPLTVGAVLLVAGALRGLALPWGSTALALAGNVLLGFAVAAVGRTRTGEPGAAASAAVVLILILPGTVPLVSHLGAHVPGLRRRRPPVRHGVVDRPGPVRGGRRRIGQRTAAPRPPMISAFSPQCLFRCGASARSASNATRPARRETSRRTANSAFQPDYYQNRSDPCISAVLVCQAAKSS